MSREESNLSVAVETPTMGEVQEKQNETIHASVLPWECMLYIFSFIRPYEEFPLATVCRDWLHVFRKWQERRHATSNREKIWKTWIGCVTNSIPRLQWALENGCARDASLFAGAASGGHLHALEWLRVQKCFWHSSACHAAAYSGHLYTLQWLRTHDYPWDANTCKCAAAGGHLHVLQWARANGCPWDKYTVLFGTLHGHEEVVTWAAANGCVCTDEDVFAFGL